ncbi:hypothetical protein H8958_009979 [Nasalis larvatus]
MEIQTDLLLQAILIVQLAIHFIWFWSDLNLESARENFYQARWKTPRIGPSDGGVGMTVRVQWMEKASYLKMLMEMSTAQGNTNQVP